jgi:transcriptional regulator with XRE-family HTH domain
MAIDEVEDVCESEEGGGIDSVDDTDGVGGTGGIETAGSKLRFERISRGLTQKELGKMLGVSLQQVQKYESGKSGVDIDKLSKVCKIFDLPAGHFFEKVSRKLVVSEQKSVKKVKDKVDASEGSNSTKEGLLLLKYFSQIENDAIKAKVLNIVKSFACKK